MSRSFDGDRRQAEGRKQCGGDDFAERAHGGVSRNKTSGELAAGFVRFGREVSIAAASECVRIVRKEVAFLTLRLR
jgi:hypothetical protein